MPLHYYYKKIIRMLGHVIGKVIKIDYNMELATRGKFACIAVEVSLESPLISQFLLDGRIQRVEYEALPTICFGCGKYGHTSSSCLDKLILKARGEKMNDMALGETTKGNSDVSPAVVTLDNPRFGFWVIMAKKGNYRGNKGRSDAKEPNQNSFGKHSVVILENKLENGTIQAPPSIPPKPNPNEEPPDIGDRDMDKVEEDSSDSEYMEESEDDESETSDESQFFIEEDNIEGAASQSLRRMFKMFVQNYKPKIVALFEPQISGIKAYDFIRFSGYDHSHQVEAAGFSGGI
ncbi:hypothetical protein KPL70_017449 [Citrus sinensis]|nr:hypothetical protein KPL70_017449 [Citrus sinensis]